MRMQDGLSCSRAKLSTFFKPRINRDQAPHHEVCRHLLQHLPVTTRAFASRQHDAAAQTLKKPLGACRTYKQTTGQADTVRSVDEVKGKLSEALEGLDRGIFGVKSAERSAIHDLLSQLESHNSCVNPAHNLKLVEGDWKLLYSTITIQGSKRTRLGLREVISLGDFIQRIDTTNHTSSNIIQFEVRGLSLLQGSLTVDAEYTPGAPQRVDIKFVKSTLVPGQLQRLFEKNYDLLLSVFNPEGWLDITFVDESHRIGRDDKGNIFYLERC